MGISWDQTGINRQEIEINLVQIKIEKRVEDKIFQHFLKKMITFFKKSFTIREMQRILISVKNRFEMRCLIFEKNVKGKNRLTS